MNDEQDISDRGPARAAPRDSLFLLTTLSTPEGAQLGKARVRNLSATGLMADCERAVPAGIKIICDLRGIGKVTGMVAWSRDDKIGLAFDEPIDPQLARKPVGAATQQTLMPDYLRTTQHGVKRR
ncbi:MULTISPECIES: PilZ domain-containing protein [Sphingobium]|uniref:PilZ domain-containing protein n=1 Tax=Sphingobium cupriresistens TaxID=1132417 RepID=A0A8G1ZEG4_9SPHN|nr:MULTISPECIES: PilZ domain-containing protein [Sphingobium]MBJ7376290.1 PilZ domain-containing protein [Sphingobium sp.]RYM07477.1 PilZ domain-containing protein [Sphingobium cupriresistens]